MQDAGVVIPPTLFIEKGTQQTLSEIANGVSWETFILKPAVSGAARHTYKFTREALEQHETIFAKLIADESLLLQEYQEQITSKGEVSYILFGGKFSHAILKKAKEGDFRVQDDFGGTVHHYTPSDDEIAFAEKAVNACQPVPVYARADVFWDNNDQLILGELELIEPELWFRMNDQAADRCAEAIIDFMR